MTQKVRLVTVFLFLLGGAFVLTRPGRTQPQQVKTAGEAFKNIQVLKDMPADQLGKVMNIMSASLGVSCSGCHVSNEGDFEKDDNHHKIVARKMIAMTFDLNRRYFDGRTEVSCNTCHRGSEHPVSVPALDRAPRTERPPQPKEPPTVAAILARYAKALGRSGKSVAGTTRVIKAERVEPDGRTREPETVIQSPGKLRVETHYGDLLVTEAFDGTTAVKTSGGSAIKLKPDEAEQIKREAQLFAEPHLSSVYSKLEYRYLDRVDGKGAYLVIGTLADGSRERLYFDAASGLLMRRVASTPTVLGAFQFQVDYMNYRPFGGVQLPTSVRFAMPGITWTREIKDVKFKKEG